MTKYLKYKQILSQIQFITTFNPLNEAGCEMAFELIEKKLKEAKEIKAGN